MRNCDAAIAGCALRGPYEESTRCHECPRIDTAFTRSASRRTNASGIGCGVAEAWIAVIALTAGLLLLVHALLLLRLARKTERWSTATATILRTSILVTVHEDPDEDHHVAVEYAYLAWGASHIVREVLPAHGWGVSRDRAHLLADEHVPGKKVAVRFNPRHPERATLMPGNPRGAWAFAALGLVCCALAIYASSL